MNLVLVANENVLKKMLAKPTFKKFAIINENLVMVEALKKTIFQCKPIFVGFCVLELSKTLMYRFHYDTIMKRYGEKARLCFTDTDSLCYWVETSDVYADMLGDLDAFDTSDYPTSHPCYSAQNKKVLGKFKDECCSKAPLEFVGLRAKMYSLLLPDDVTKAVCKGVKRSYQSQHLKHINYLQTLETNETALATFRTIRSFNHALYTIEQTKVSLSSFDDKRYVLRSHGTLAHGHCRIPALMAADAAEAAAKAAADV